MRLEFIGMTIIGFTAFLSIEGNTPPTLAALALVYSLEVTRYLKHGTDQASQVPFPLPYPPFTSNYRFRSQQNHVELFNARASRCHALLLQAPESAVGPA